LIGSGFSLILSPFRDFMLAQENPLVNNNSHYYFNFFFHK